MSYQTEETIPMVDEGNVTPKIAKKESYGLVDEGNVTPKIAKKGSYGLVAFMVICLAVTSFMAGHAYNSAASASVINARAGWSQGESCWRWFSQIYSKGGKEAGDCVTAIWTNGGGNYDSCSSSAPTCSWEISIINSQC